MIRVYFYYALVRWSVMRETCGWLGGWMSQDWLISLPVDRHDCLDDTGTWTDEWLDEVRAYFSISSCADHWQQKHMNKHTAKTDLPSNTTCTRTYTECTRTRAGAEISWSWSEISKVVVWFSPPPPSHSSKSTVFTLSIVVYFGLIAPNYKLSTG